MPNLKGLAQRVMIIPISDSTTRRYRHITDYDPIKSDKRTFQDVLAFFQYAAVDSNEVRIPIFSSLTGIVKESIVLKPVLLSPTITPIHSFKRMTKYIVSTNKITTVDVSYCKLKMHNKIMHA